MSRLRHFLDDPRGLLCLHVRHAAVALHRAASTAAARLSAWTKGVETGGCLSCRGIPYFERTPHSTIRLGRGCTIHSSFRANHIGSMTRTRIVTITPTAAIQIGDRVGLSGATVTAFCRIDIGPDTMVGAGSLITDCDWHATDPAERHTSIGAVAPVTIGRNVLIGTRCIVLKGVTIGDDSVIGAGSVVTRDIPAGVIAAGNPCRVVRSIYNKEA